MIRLAKENDLNFLSAVELSAAKKFREYLGDDTAQGQGSLDHTILLDAHHNNSLWIAEMEGKIIGFLAATLKKNSLHIEEISVMYEHQGLGLGKRLISKLIKDAGKRNYSFLSLTTDSQIPWNKPFYTKLGFAEIKIEDCPNELKAILKKEKDHHIADNRIAMVKELSFK